MDASLGNELKYLTIRLRRFYEALLDGSRKDQVGYNEVLARGETERLKRAHETKDRLELVLCNIPVLFKKVQGDDAGYIFAACTNCQLTLFL